ncbi:MAG TPA: acyl-CoA dehydratase activase, partial [bacterium]|nr:acyl-CoA dehydratase activase [bacterium]
MALTGSGGRLGARLLGGEFVNEVVAQSTSVIALHPEARSVIEMGGEDAKLILIGRDNGVPVLRDFSMTGMCAAGTGSFLDQQAARMGLSIEREFGELALKSQTPPRIAGRCSVFAKSDMIHLQQLATPLHDIAAGLCFAVARNFRSNVARGRDLERPVVFQGGVAANAGMVRAFREVFGLDALIVPAHHAAMGAIGAARHVRDRVPAPEPFRGMRELEEYLRTDRRDGSYFEPLRAPSSLGRKDVTAVFPETGTLRVALGIDVGSLSTNVVLIDEQDRVAARRYLPTASKPLDAIRKGLAEIQEEVGDRVEVTAVGTTGSGRYLTGDFVGADLIQNEITAQATAAIAMDPGVDTIFEIGGQDSKYISVDRGVVVDFEMNKVCAAGTGSFLQEQAEKLGIRIEEQFGKMALEARTPAGLGDRCTVFMESDLNSLQQKGETTENLVGGLAYSIVSNYIQKVVGTRRIGQRIFFQGGVANNHAVIAAFEQVTGKPVTVPPHFDVTGAIGAAMLARRHVLQVGARTRFRGFDIARVPFTVDTFTCRSCSNQCEIRRVRIQGSVKPLYYGGRCEKWEVEERKGRGREIPNLFAERTAMLLGGFQEDSAAGVEGGAAGDRRPIVGIPRALMVFWGQFPFWKTFFETLHFKLVLSRPTDRQLITRSVETQTSETCFPVEVMHGHIRDLLDQGVDHIFAPFVVEGRAEADNPTVNYNCPWVQSAPFMVRAALKGGPNEGRLLTPTLHFRYFERGLREELPRYMEEKLGVPTRHSRAAVDAADAAQKAYEERLRERGRDVMAALDGRHPAAVLMGRPYNTLDSALNLGLVDKLISLDVLPIPMDYLPLAQEKAYLEYSMVCWPNGQRIMAAARIAARDPRLTAVYLGNFRCGPDSFLQHYVREEMAGKPYLQLEVDEHSADAGMVTRLEAFLDSLRGASHAARQAGLPMAAAPGHRHDFRPDATAASHRTLYFPYMSDGAYAL